MDNIIRGITCSPPKDAQLTVQNIYDKVRRLDAEIGEVNDGVEELELCGMCGGAAHKILLDKLDGLEEQRDAFLKQQIQIVGIR